MGSNHRKDEAQRVLAACAHPDRARECYDELIRQVRGNHLSGGMVDELQCAATACELSC